MSEIEKLRALLDEARDWIISVGGSDDDFLDRLDAALMESKGNNMNNIQAVASKHNTSRTSKGQKYFYMLHNGTILADWQVRIPRPDGQVFEVDAYGGIMGTYQLGVDIWAVRRDRQTVVTETYTVV